MIGQSDPQKCRFRTFYVGIDKLDSIVRNAPFQSVSVIYRHLGHNNGTRNFAGASTDRKPVVIEEKRHTEGRSEETMKLSGMLI